MSFLIADGVVPSNEDRGYVLRRLTRRAILQGRRLEMAPGFLLRYAAVVRELMAGAYPELLDQRDPIERWLASEEDAFGRTLEQGTGLLDELIARALDTGDAGDRGGRRVCPARHLRLPVRPDARARGRAGAGRRGARGSSG